MTCYFELRNAHKHLKILTVLGGHGPCQAPQFRHGFLALFSKEFHKCILFLIDFKK
jgi:hypothetical protein